MGGGVGLGVGLSVGIAVLQSAFFAVAWPLGVIAGSFILARGLYASNVRRRQRVLRDLLDELIEHVEAVAGRELEPGATAPQLPG